MDASSPESVGLAIVVGNEPAIAGVRLIDVMPSGPWAFVPGQVAELALGEGTEGYFAIASAPSESPPVSFLVKADGSASEALMTVLPGAAITLRGPFGRGFSLPSETTGEAAQGDLLFVAAGTAIAAARGAIRELLARGTRARMALLLGVRRVADVCFGDELARWHARGVEVRVCVSDGTIPAAAPFPAVPGRVQGQLASFARPGTEAFIAGSEALEDDVTEALVRLGVALPKIQRNYRPDARGR